MYRWFCVYILYTFKEITVVLTHFGHEYYVAVLETEETYFSHILSTSLNSAVTYTDLLLRVGRAIHTS